jgi:hypothetical protein
MPDMPDSYDDWKLATPPEYQDEDPPDYGDEPPCPFCRREPMECICEELAQILAEAEVEEDEITRAMLRGAL